MRERPRPRPADSGFTLVEVIAVVAIVGILATMTALVMSSTRGNASSASVKSDLRNYSAAAGEHWSSRFTYPDSPAGFALRDADDNGMPITTGDSQFVAFVIPEGPNAGYIIFGANPDVDNVLVLSSWDGKTPRTTELTTLPTSPPEANTYGIPASVVDDDWAPKEGIRFPGGEG